MEERNCNKRKQLACLEKNKRIFGTYITEPPH